MTNKEKAVEAFEIMEKELRQYPMEDGAWAAICDCINAICELLPAEND